MAAMYAQQITSLIAKVPSIPLPRHELFSGIANFLNAIGYSKEAQSIAQQALQAFQRQFSPLDGEKHIEIADLLCALGTKKKKLILCSLYC
jgi:hypothetical protein